MKIFKIFFNILLPNERRLSGYLLIMLLIMSFLETIGVLSILPFIAILSNPDLINSNLIINKFYQFLKTYGVDSYNKFLVLVGIITFIFFVFSTFFKAIVIYVQAKFIYLCEYNISKRLIEKYLNQPYSWFLSKNSSELGKNILSEVSVVIGKGISPLLDLIARSMITIAIVVMLFIVEPKLSLIICIVLGILYGIVYFLVRTNLKGIGIKNFESNAMRFKMISETFGAFKEIKFGNNEQFYIKSFSNYAKKFSSYQANLTFINQLPRLVLEVFVFGGLLLIAIYSLKQKSNFNDVIPIISFYAFAGYRLMPSLQQIYASLTQLSFAGPSIDKVTGDLNNGAFIENNLKQNPIRFQDKITLENVEYAYPETSRLVLKNISLNIPKNFKVGFIGTTGSGKTTLIDIILGLLSPKKGVLKIDGKIITKHNSIFWRHLVGYVPQNIYLSDNTLTKNIAFGVDPEKINQDLVEQVSKAANLHQFIIDKLPDKYQTIIGERGIRLSGGERQRIGIARALYHKPEVLVLDESTRDLDNETEKKVMHEITKLSKHQTIIIVAHRLNTVKNCDIIFKFEKGKIIERGTYEEVIKN